MLPPYKVRRSDEICRPRMVNRTPSWITPRRARRCYRSWLLRASLLLLLVYSIIDAYIVYAAHADDAAPLTSTSSSTHHTPRIFIASMHWNNEAILRSHWNQAVLDLMQFYGKDKTFLSIQESGSWDDTKGALSDLDRLLEAGGYRRKLVLSNTTHLDEISQTSRNAGWIDTPRGMRELRRIPYLSRLRNLVLEPLAELAAAGEKFDKIIWLNDVIFTTRDIQVLLNTRDGDYATVCSLDFSKPSGFYDTFALRDLEGYNKLMKNWPYFRAESSRQAAKANKPVPVSSCWNGIAVMDSAPFYGATPLQYRGIPDSLAEYHIEGSECCLIHVDNPLSASKGVWLNPSVRVAYNEEAHRMVNPKTRPWLSFWSIYWALWENRLRRWFTTTHFVDAIVTRRLRAWSAKSPEHTEPGTVCLVNEMQVIVESGWAHV